MLMAGMFELFLDVESRYRFRLSAPDGTVLAVSRGFADKPAAVAGIRDARECAATALTTDPGPRRGAEDAGSPVGITAEDGTSVAPIADLKVASGPDVAEYAPDALLIIGQEGDITYLNAAAETLFGHQRERLLGQHYEIIIPGRFQGHNEGIREAFATDPRMRQVGTDRDLFGLRRDGTEFPMEVNLAPLTVTGRSGIVASIRDVTERKRSDTALREALTGQCDAGVHGGRHPGRDRRGEDRRGKRTVRDHVGHPGGSAGLAR